MNRCVFAPASPAEIVKAAVARSNVNVYAVVDACVSSHNDGNPGDKSWAAESGQQSCSRIGFKGREELGNGMSAGDRLKKGINAGTGAFTRRHSTTSALYGRQTWAGPGTCYLYRPMSVQFSYHKATTVTGPTASGGIASEERVAFIGAIYDFAAGKTHVVYADKKLPAIKDDGKDHKDLLGVPALAGTAGTVVASDSRGQVRDMSPGYFDRYTIGYTYLLPICANLYTPYSSLKNEDAAALATYNDSVHGANAKRFNVNVRHML